MDTPEISASQNISMNDDLTELLRQEELKLPAPEDDSVRKLVEPTQTFNAETPGGELHEFFEAHPNAEGVVVLSRGQAPLGLVMRNEYYQKLGSPYGRDLFLMRSVQLVMNPRPLIVDVSVDIATISMIAMNRPQKELYDMVIVTEAEKFLGVVSIKRFMIELSRNREKEIELLKKQKDILRLANEAEVGHRLQIEEKNNELRERSQAVKNLLDNAGQGFLSFGRDLQISEEHSLECVQIFRSPIGGKNFPELMEKHVSQENLAMMGKVFNNVFNAPKDLQQKVYLSLLPSEFTIYNKAVAVEYKVIQHAGHKRMMLILTDITEKKELEQKMEQERRNLGLVVKALAQQSEVNAAFDEFIGFVQQEAPALLRAAPDPATALKELFRAIHTFKGDLSQIGLHNTAARLHELENGLAELCEHADACDAHQLVDLISGWDAAEIISEDKRVITKALGRSFFENEERFLISKDKLLEVERLVYRILPREEQDLVMPLLRDLRRHNIKNLLKAQEDYLATLAARLDKAIEPLDVTGDDVLVDKEIYHKFLKSLVHVFRNMIDHGIETPEERLEAGKRELGRISCQVKRKGDSRFKISISDDGAGINPDRIIALALAKGILDPTQAATLNNDEIYAILFMDAFSTKDEVTTLSGRGVGLAAVKAEVQQLGGRVSVWSSPGEGTTFSFILPLLED